MEEYHHKLHITSLLNHNLYVTAQVKDYLLRKFQNLYTMTKMCQFQKENVITQDRGVSSRKENASQPDQDAVPANKRSQKLLSIGETQKLRIVLSPQQNKMYK